MRMVTVRKDGGCDLPSRGGVGVDLVLFMGYRFVQNTNGKGTNWKYFFIK